MEINPKNTYLFSDPHFDHTNIIRYCHRPFKNIEEMNNIILKNYNKIVKTNSLVYFLGDMAFGRYSRPYGYWFKQLKGNIIRFKGNHDKKGYKETVIHVGDTYLKLSHFPSNRGDWVGWMVHGHVHDKNPFIDFQNKNINVSVDATGFKPVRLSDILRKIK
jgi:calcineurin-like phosphoesterase family protein